MMFGFFKERLIGFLSACTTETFGRSLAANSKGHTKLFSLNNQTCQARPTLLDINSDEPLFYPFILCVNKFGGNSNSIDDLFSGIYVPDKLKISL